MNQTQFLLKYPRPSSGNEKRRVKEFEAAILLNEVQEIKEAGTALDKNENEWTMYEFYYKGGSRFRAFGPVVAWSTFPIKKFIHIKKFL